MPATFRTFLNGMAQGAQYIPDILQDIAIQRQRQQQINLGVREQEFKENIYEKEAPQRQANLEATLAGTEASLATTDERIAAKLLSDLEYDMMLKGRADKEKLDKLAVEEQIYKTATSKMDKEHYLTKQAHEDELFDAQIGQVRATTSGMLATTMTTMVELRKALLTFGALAAKYPEDAALLDPFTITDPADIRKIVPQLKGMSKPMANAVLKIGDIALEMVNYETETKAKIYMSALNQYKGNVEKATNFTNAYMKNWHAERDPILNEFFPWMLPTGGNAGSINFDAITGDRGGAENTPTQTGDWRNNPQLQGGGVGIRGAQGIYESWNKPNIGMQP